MIDWNRVRNLRDEIGIDAFEEVVDLFIEEVETEIEKLRTPDEALDIEAQLHFLKGSALNLGFADFSDLCHRGEGAADKGLAAEVDLVEILNCFDRSKAAFLTGLTPEVINA
ncbi:Hpt domain-containing protein [uncultured Roseovarius sp.]|uniref:Hpt domain-containing protein n=1 Tax=uncultured Roseovarius sp. TaxID=293344 RepID=UPI00261265C4|nr:Hpt domain-containing protein [uncultured Roseovarius sp.]